MPVRGKLFIAGSIVLSAPTLLFALRHWHSYDSVRFACYLVAGVLASRLKVRLPGIDGTMSVSFLFVLLGVMELSLGETILIGCSSTLAQCLWKPQSPSHPTKILFNVFGMMANTACLSFITYRLLASHLPESAALFGFGASVTYFFSNTLPVAYVIAISEEKTLRQVWVRSYFWTFPCYLAGAAIVALVHFCNLRFGWQSTLLISPLVYWVYHSYQLHLGRLEDAKNRAEADQQQIQAEKQHVEEVAALQTRTVEALALAIGAKDHTTHQHLQRVRTYAVAIGKDLGLTESEVMALRAASLLHDIGKLAVPEHIISKPGRLTPEEFEKMKIHPTVGAAILDKIAFPYPVAPIVRSHHERWDGSGYPDGLKGEQIPIGARILAVVDCFDALASNRQYRKALPLEEAIEKISAEAGTSFDPSVVKILEQKYLRLEELAVSDEENQSLAKFTVIEQTQKRHRPATGFERADRIGRREEDVLSCIAAARHEAQTLFELGHELGISLSLDETLSLVSVKLRKLVPYDALAAFIQRGNKLSAEFVTGDNYRLLSTLEIPLGEGLCGWVAQNQKPIINGNPAVEPGYQSDPKRLTDLRSALAVPLVGAHGPVGVLALYQNRSDAFTNDHLRILQVVMSKIAITLENALRYRRAEQSATTDYLTALPNARSLFLHLEQELAQCKRNGSTLALMVCDMDGFKQINDRHGHIVGDKALKVFADSLKGLCRDHEYPARMGGDEFVIVARDVGADSVAAKVVLLGALATRAGRDVCGDTRLALSVGTAFYPEDGSSAEQLLAEADKRMYQIKGMHRNDTTDHVRAVRASAGGFM